MKKIFYILPLLLVSCTKGNLDMLGMFYTLSDGNDERFAQSMEWNDQVGYDTIQVAQDDYKVYTFTDIHVDTTTFNLDTFTTAYLNDTEAAPFCLCLGDQINAINNYPKFFAYIDKMKAAGKKVYSTPGNHDLYYDQWSIYRDYWKTSAYWFLVQTPGGFEDLYICLDSSDGTLGIDQRKWLEQLLKEKSQMGYRHIIVFTHTHFWKRDQSQGHTSNFALEETYEIADIFGKYNVDIVLQGHSHYRYKTVFKGVTYLRLDKMEDHYYNSHYTTFQIGNDIDWTFVPVGPQTEGVGANDVRIEGR